MKFGPTLTVIGSVNALSNTELSQFKCRSGSFYSYSHGNGNEFSTATSSNGYNGCHPNHGTPCVKEQLKCSIKISEKSGKLEIETSSQPDHNAWILEHNSNGGGAIRKFRVPASPSLQSINNAVDAKEGVVGYAVNGVEIYSPYNADTCCDFKADRVNFVDYCNGYSSSTYPSYGTYHYHFLPDSGANCGLDEIAADRKIVGVARDGFAFYGPSQYWSKSQNKVYNDPSRCSDCQLTTITAQHTDECGGVEVADGSSNDGTQYRYIITADYPYTLKCYRGSITQAEEYCGISSSWNNFQIKGDCDGEGWFGQQYCSQAPPPITTKGPDTTQTKPTITTGKPEPTVTTRPATTDGTNPATTSGNTRPTRSSRETRSSRQTRSTDGTNTTRPPTTGATTRPPTTGATTRPPTTKVTTKATTTEPDGHETSCDNNDLADKYFVLYNSSQYSETYKAGSSVDISCSKGTTGTMNRAKVGAQCVCNNGHCRFEAKKDGWKCIPEDVCPLPNFQGAKFNYVIDADLDDPWAYMRFRFRAVLDDENHPEWDKNFWKNSDWTGIVACPFSSHVEGKDPLDGIYFETGSSSYNSRMHTVMGRDGHRLLGEKGEVLRSALLIPDGSPWETKDKVYTCEVGVVPGYHPDLAACIEQHFGDLIYEHFQTQPVPMNMNELEDGLDNGEWGK